MFADTAMWKQQLISCGRWGGENVRLFSFAYFFVSVASIGRLEKDCSTAVS